MRSHPHGTFDLAITSPALRWIFTNCSKDFVDYIIRTCVIFARAKPTDKSAIIERLIHMGRYTAMCGDGTNDCGALKTAHVGLALSDTEASIVAPFTSSKKSISDVPKLLAEGRCALDTSFTAFKYMAIYPVIQLFTASIAYWFETQLSDFMYLVDDLVVVFPLATLMTYGGPPQTQSSSQKTHDKSSSSKSRSDSESINAPPPPSDTTNSTTTPSITSHPPKPRKPSITHRPTDSLFSLLVLSSLLGQVLINVTFIFTSTALLFSQPHINPTDPSGGWFCTTRTATANVNDAYKPINPFGVPQSYLDLLTSSSESEFPGGLGLEVETLPPIFINFTEAVGNGSLAEWYRSTYPCYYIDVERDVKREVLTPTYE
ncbi:hypothetical protein HK102_011364, partial [Quaeritorhiza haematococci]